MNIDAKNLVLGRIASTAARKALLGEEVNILNTELAIITGGRFVEDKYMHRVQRSPDPTHGPFFPRTPIGIMRRTIRGMLPYKQGRGREAFERIKCYMGVPENFKNAKLESVDKANFSKLPKYNFLILKELCRSLGWRK